MIKLGDRVKDSISGFIGIAVAKVTYLQGCERYAVQSPVKKNEIPLSWQYFDGPQLMVLKSQVIKEGNRVPGGFQPDAAERP